MKIGLIDVDGHNFPNVPLMKLAAYHKKRGDTVEWWERACTYSIVYKSKVFTFTPDISEVPRADCVIAGGTGYSISGGLPDEAEHMMPDYSIYPQYQEAYGFLTRGCPNNCGFCIVTQKEGAQSKQVAELGEFQPGQRSIKLLDPNLLACADHERLLQQLIDGRAMVDFTQGLDIRRVTADNTALIKKLKLEAIHFAWDNPKQDLTGHFRRFKEQTGFGYRKLGVYVLTNYNSTLQEDLHRVYTLRDLGYNPYVMIYNKGDYVTPANKLKPLPELLRTFTAAQVEHFRAVWKLQGWVNNRIAFRACQRYEDFDRAAHRKKAPQAQREVYEQLTFS